MMELTVNVCSTFTNWLFLPLNQVLTNVGADYNAATGRYTAPVNGTYEFKVTVSARGKQKVRTII